jgi:L-alanine-DL-glutamate epimerase-like enolase superfamily enzyme
VQNGWQGLNKKMKITRITTFNVAFKLKKPLTIAKMVREKSSNTIVKIETDEGIEGFGEATFAPFFAGETQDSVKMTIDKFLSPALTGMDPMNLLSLVDEMNRTITANPFAKAAVEMAAWDIKGKALGVPVYDLLGGFRRKSIPVAHSVSTGTVPQMVEQTLEHVRHGFKTLKIYCGRETPESDLERIRQIRKVVGKDIGLYVELNQRWSFKTALAFLPDLKDLGILFLEQPISGHLLEEMRILRKHSSIPIALDESIFSPEDVASAKQQGVADIVNIYVLKAGGILNAKRAIDVSEAVGLDCFVGSLNELGISTMAGAHLSATISKLTYPCYLVGPMLYEEDILTEALDISDGMLHLSDSPGLGIQVNEKRLKEFTC